MGRPREFDVDRALDRAMNVFWSKGYEGASLHDLLAAMKIVRGSLYKAFRNKRGIYLAALDRYDRTVVEEAVVMLRNRSLGEGFTRIGLLLRSASEAVAKRGDRRGCLLCNAAVDPAPADPAIRARVHSMMKRLERAIEVALADSELAASWARQRRHATAQVLTVAYMGLRVIAKAGYTPAEINAAIAASMRTLRLT